MTTELALLLERVRQARQARAVAIADATRGPSCAESRQGCTFHSGDRVFDTVSGSEAQVVSAALENLVVSTAGK